MSTKKQKKKFACAHPPQTGPYKVQPKKGGWSQFGTDACILGISIGQDYHEGDKFACLVDWAKNRFERVEIMVADSLQRHNFIYARDIDHDEAYTLSIKAGDEWLARQKDVIAGTDIFRWNDFLGLPKTQNYYQNLSQEYETNLKMRHHLDKVIKGMYMRLYKRDPKAHSLDRFKDFYQTSKAYLLEEAAVNSYIDLQKKTPVIYPGELIFDCTIDDNSRGIRPMKHFVSVTLIRNKSYWKKAA